MGREIKNVTVGTMYTNCYIVKNTETGEALVFDPGAEPEKIKAACEELACKPVAILLTHGHFDHIGAVSVLSRAYQIPIYAGVEEQDILTQPEWNLSAQFRGDLSLQADHYLDDDTVLSVAGFYVTVLATPGHTKGGVCYFFPVEKILVSGDTLFLESIGRTDLPTGDHETLITSVKEKLYQLPNETLVFPGHGPATTIEYEKRRNPYVREGITLR